MQIWVIVLGTGIYKDLLEEPTEQLSRRAINNRQPNHRYTQIYTLLLTYFRAYLVLEPVRRLHNGDESGTSHIMLRERVWKLRVDLTKQRNRGSNEKHQLEYHHHYFPPRYPNTANAMGTTITLTNCAPTPPNSIIVQNNNFEISVERRRVT